METLTVNKHMELNRFIRLMGITTDTVPLNSLIHGGNAKVPSTTAIFNMGAAKDCPSRKLGYCQAISKSGKNCCYAEKSERLHPEVLPYRRRQMKYWKSVTANRFVTEFLMLNAWKVIPFKALRFNESGDFWGQEDLNKAEEIARHLKKYGIRTYCYTARRDLDFSKVRSLVISGSNFQKEGVRGIFKMVYSKKEKPAGYGICRGDCRVCERCLIGRKTVILKH